MGGDLKSMILSASTGAIVGPAISMLIGSMVSTDQSHRDWYDYLSHIYVFPEEYTELIDMLLMKERQAVLSSRIVKSANHHVPGLGSHKLYWKDAGGWNGWDYITFKKEEKNDKIYYIVYTTRRQMSTFEEAVKKIFAPDINKIRTISIDTSRQVPFPMFIDKLMSGSEKSHQTTAINHILEGWFDAVQLAATILTFGKGVIPCPNINDPKRYSRQIVLCGVRGSGKSYIGRLLKKRMEAISNSLMIRLYDNFNPSSPGSSINLLVLQYAKAITPVVLIIDEIDICFKRAANGTHANKHAALVHTRDKASLNNMLDGISDTEHMIAIYTTEKSPEDLYAHPEWHSYLREGRVNYFLKYVPDPAEPDGFKCEKVLHKNIVGYSNVPVPDSDSEDDVEE